ncbi:hypothetical protein Rsub_00933 [Raphidocelis subcapitata]|uniref:Uncharacterized protein n=1 Tax=Raphidocelis subcapitata TaxID=307507 RepID=A0A2V0NLE4_9CHLO|nr:hypothetical protein Rsub_00933 [Raphidocelis subcapitata]|eukprot:GBF88221.1 hypothetical protein Rsub_00933 [Raphidocelis subcapitata]
MMPFFPSFPGMLPEDNGPFKPEEAARLKKQVSAALDASAPLKQRLDAVAVLNADAGFGSLVREAERAGAVPALATLLLADFPADGDLPASRADADAVAAVKVGRRGPAMVKSKSLRRAAAEALCDMANYPTHVAAMLSAGIFRESGAERLLAALLPRVDWRLRVTEWVTGRDQTYMIAERLVCMCANAMPHVAEAVRRWALSSVLPLVFTHIKTPQHLVNDIATAAFAEAHRRRKARLARLAAPPAGERAARARLGSMRLADAPSGGGAAGFEAGREANGVLDYMPAESDLYGDDSEDEGEGERTDRRGARQAVEEDEVFARDGERAICACQAAWSYWKAEGGEHRDAPNTPDPDRGAPMHMLRGSAYMAAFRLLSAVISLTRPSGGGSLGFPDFEMSELVRLAEEHGAIGKLEGMGCIIPTDLWRGVHGAMRLMYTSHAVTRAPIWRAQLVADARRATELRQAGNEHFSSGRLQEAVVAYVSALRLDSSDSAALNNLALCWLKLGHPGRARWAAQETLRADPANPKAWARYGDCFTAARRPQLAQLCYKQAMALGARKDELEPRLNAAIEGLKGRPAWDVATIPDAAADRDRYRAWLKLPPRSPLDCVNPAAESMEMWGDEFMRVINDSKHIAAFHIKPLSSLAACARKTASDARALPAADESWIVSWSDTPLVSQETGIVKCLLNVQPTYGGEEFGLHMLQVLGVPRTKQVCLAIRAALFHPQYKGRRRRPSDVTIAARLALWGDEITRELRAFSIDNVYVQSQEEARIYCPENDTAADGFNHRGEWEVARAGRLPPPASKERSKA